jgi:FixJ family two-component response regulator
VSAENLGKTEDPSQPSVWVLDSDAVSLGLVQRLLERHSMQVTCCESIRRFAAHYQPGMAQCLILESRLQDGDGLALQRELSACGDLLPTVFLAAAADIATAVAAMKAGAADFLLKPIDSAPLMDAVQAAIVRANRYRQFQDSFLIARRLQDLTDREREVLDLVLAGWSTKQISVKLYRVEKTVEFHRQNIMKKLGASNVAHLVRLVTTADHALAVRQIGASGNVPGGGSGRATGRNGTRLQTRRT